MPGEGLTVLASSATKSYILHDLCHAYILSFTAQAGRRVLQPVVSGTGFESLSNIEQIKNFHEIISKYSNSNHI